MKGPRPALACALAGLALAGLATPSLAAGEGDALLSGRDIYARVLENRFRSFTEESRLVSGDLTGRAQETRLRLHWKDFRNGDGAPAGGILSKALVRYTYPADLRSAGYLVQSNAGRPNDQFVYYPSRRRVVRVNLRNEALHGTDFSFEDVIPRELEDATYRRLADAAWAGFPVYVVELVPREPGASEYSRIEVSVDQRRFVPLRSRYWDAAGVEIKELAVNPYTLEEHEGVWIAREATMRHLLHETWTKLFVTSFVANPELAESTFDLSRLEGH